MHCALGPRLVSQLCCRETAKIDNVAQGKHKGRKSDRGRRMKFEGDIDQLWDIGAMDAIKQI